MITRSTELHEGERRKADALDLLAECREVYILRGRRALLTALLCSETATIDEARDVVDLPPGMNPKLFGVVPGLLAKSGIIRQAGFAKTSRPAGHARTVTLWELADHAAAVRWLRDHPDVPDSAQGDKPIATAGQQGVLFDLQEKATPTAGTVGDCG
jgi:hypothetical protein